MEVSDIVEEETALPSEDIAINSGCSATLEVPFLTTVVREGWVGVVEIGDHDD